MQVPCLFWKGITKITASELIITKDRYRHKKIRFRY